MASSSSASFVISIESESTREATPEFDPIAAYEARAPLHWDAEEWDFQTWSEDVESLTDGEDFQLLLGGELNLDDDDDDLSWEGDFSTSKEEVDDASTEEDSTAAGFLRGGSLEDNEDDDDEETEGGSGYSGDGGGDDTSSDNDGSDDDSDIGAAPPIKRCKVLGTYWW
jgi:hypothetical protein